MSNKKEFKNPLAEKKATVEESVDLQKQGYLLIENYVEEGVRYHELRKAEKTEVDSKIEIPKEEKKK